MHPDLPSIHLFKSQDFLLGKTLRAHDTRLNDRLLDEDLPQFLDLKAKPGASGIDVAAVALILGAASQQTRQDTTSPAHSHLPACSALLIQGIIAGTS